MSSPIASMRQRPLAAALAAALILTPAPVLAASVFVTNCNDSGLGSLRLAVSQAGTGDTVDLSGLTSSTPGCVNSTITLTTGEILITKAVATIKGPVSPRITINQICSAGGNNCRIFSQKYSGSGASLSVDNLTVSQGLYIGSNARGGCLYSTGNINISNSIVDSCVAKATDPTGDSYGGAVFGKKVILSYSMVTNSVAQSVGATGVARGGGVFSSQSTYTFNSSVSGNKAINANSSHYSAGGGIWSSGTTRLYSSTISSNSADAGGGAFTGHAFVETSTISGNAATTQGGGGMVIANCTSAYCQVNSLVTASTVTSNTAGGTTITGASAHISAGLAVMMPVGLNDSLIANNTYGAAKISDDFSTSSVFSGPNRNNLIRVPATIVPADTIVGRCPILGVLRYNGGPTQTVALESGSPGIDQGLDYGNEDQRGLATDKAPFPYPRVSGSAADIGAYEVQQNEIIFTANFEGCP